MDTVGSGLLGLLSLTVWALVSVCVWGGGRLLHPCAKLFLHWPDLGRTLSPFPPFSQGLVHARMCFSLDGSGVKLLTWIRQQALVSCGVTPA